MKTKTKLAWIVIAFMLALSAMVVGIWAVSTATVNLGGNISFTADDIYAEITGSISGAKAGDDTTLKPLNYSATTEPTADDLDTWKGKSLNFADKSTDIVITITIENLSSERKLKTIIKDTIEETQTETNLEKSVSFTNDGQTVATENAEGVLFEIPAGERKAATYQITLHIKDKNKSVQANYGYDLELYDENSVEQPKSATNLIDEGMKFTFNDNKTASVMQADDVEPVGTLIIPSQVINDYAEGDDEIYTVTSIAEEGFYECYELTSVTIPNSVTSLGNYAFNDCDILLNLSLPDSITSIGEFAFAYCEKLQSIKLPKNLTCLRRPLFEGDEMLSSVEIPNSVISIEDYAFDSCSSLISLTIPNSVTIIGDNAFNYCSGLTYNEYDNGYYLGNSENPYIILVKAKDTSITSCEINSNTKFIHSGAFSGCSNLTYNEYDNGQYLGNDENPYIILVKAKNTSITSCEINSNTKFIHSSAFSGCSSLQSITIPDSVTSIGSYAFSGCSGLTSVTIGNSVTSIGNWAFYGCSKLTSITIPDSVLTIGDLAFSGCSSLQSITIPDSVISIGSYAFFGCSSLQSITIPDSVTIIGYSAFSGCSSLASITIPNSVTIIRQSAFSDCSGLTSVTIGNSVTSIGYQAFYGCSGLTTVVIDSPYVASGLASQTSMEYLIDYATKVYVKEGLTAGSYLTNTANFTVADESDINNIAGYVLYNKVN